MSVDERVEVVTTGQPEVQLLACTRCGVIAWNIDAHYSHAHPHGEEPEWEFGIRAEGDEEPYTDYSDDSDWLCDQVTPEPGDAIVRRRKAGPWVPVKQEGAGT